MLVLGSLVNFSAVIFRPEKMYFLKMCVILPMTAYF